MSADPRLVAALQQAEQLVQMLREGVRGEPQVAGADSPWLDEEAEAAFFASISGQFFYRYPPSRFAEWTEAGKERWRSVVRAVHAVIAKQAPSLRLLDIVSSQIDNARADGRREAIEECAKVADGFTCGACGMDGKASAAIRALAKP